MARSLQGYIAPVTVDTRALIDKVLARYSCKFPVFRELLQDSDDAGCDSAEIHFEFVAFSPHGPPLPPDLDTTHVLQWTFRNHGKPFRPQDWMRLPRIALGNPDRTKIGAFGVGFFSVFSITENPCVSSGDKEMEFWWDEENQLRYRFDDRPKTDLWTTFKIPLREAAPMPPIAELMQFLASSITFMVRLEKVAVFFDDRQVGQITKSLGHSQPIPIPNELRRSSLENIMTVKSVEKHPITIDARITLPQRDLHETKVVTVFTAEVDVAVDGKFSKELNRCMKKKPPSDLKYRLTYTGKDEHDRSHKSEQNHQFPSPFQGLRADLDGAMHTRIFIGHATAQTTGIGGHMASHFIPTVEREWIDFVDINVATWNRELLHVGGILCRTVYELELSEIQDSWKEAAANEPDLRRELQDQLHKRFLHVLKFFTFHRSTPSSTVAELLADSFYGCSTLPLRLLSSVGVRGAPHVREFDPVLAKFLKSVPMLSEHVTQYGARSIAALPDKHKISAITPSDILEDLRGHTLDTEELVTFLRWWMNSARDELASDLVDQLLSAATLRGNTGEEICLSSVTSFIDPKVLGPHIPSDGPLPLSLIPIGVSWHFDFKELVSLRLKEFTVASWLRHLSDPDVVSADEEHDFTRSADWARRVFSTLSRVWLQLPEDIRHESRKAFRNKPCIPTSKGLCYPECSYLPITDGTQFQHLDLPIVSWDSGFEADMDMERCLLSLGVRKDPPVHFLLDQMRPRGNWTVLDLIKYLVQEERSLTDDDISGLKLIKIFTKEDSEDSSEENIGCCADELFPPVDTFRKLQLPIIEWSEKLEWRDTSSEARLLYRLGLNHFPSLPKIVELCSSEEEEVQETAFTYLCRELQSRYSAYKPENFQDVEFIPAESNGRTCLKKLGEVCTSTQWRALGFFVVQEQYLSMPLGHLGVMPHPSVSKLLDLLEKSPLPDEWTASACHWFNVLSDCLSSFEPSDLSKLSSLPIVPTGPWNAPKLLPPTKCYLDQSSKPAFYAELFVVVDFGARANSFLGACGLKNKVLIEDIAGALVEDPGRFFELAGGHEGFLVELRKIASQSQDISCDTLHKMSQTPALLGLCRKKTENLAKWDYEYRFMTSHGVTIVDDPGDYQLFSDCLFVAPREEVIEHFYASLGCRYLSTVVKENYSGLHEIQATETCREVQSLILERLPLFIQKYTDTKPEVIIPSSLDHLQVKACERILISKTLVTKNVQRTQDMWAIVRHEVDCIELWISQTAKRDMYEIVTSLCRVLFGTNETNATVLLEMVLSTDLEALERRGFLVDQISQQQRDGYMVENDMRREHLAGSALAPNSSRQFTTPATQPALVADHGIRTLRSQSIGDFQQWMRRNSINTEMPISGPDSSTSSSDIYHMLAYNALRKVRLENWSSAYDDATKSITTLPSTMGYIAKALAQIGRGEPSEAMQVFDIALRSCDSRESNLLLLIKAVALFVAGKYDTAISRVHDLIALERDDEAMHCCVQVLGKMYLMQGDYARAVQSLQDHTSSCTSCNLETISLIFGWTFNGLQVTLQRCHFEDLYAAGRMGEATETLRMILDSFGEEIGASEVTPEWVLDSQKKCIEILETLGDQALSSGKHNDAITRYTSALSLNPSNPIDILMKRSKTRASNGSWEDALTDADEVIKLDPSSHRGYARKYMALHGLGDYDAAYDALLHLISVSEDSSDEEMNRLRSNYNRAIAAIDSATDAIFKLCPLVLIDLAMGQLCDREGRRRTFRSETPFKKLVSEAAIAGVDRKHIRQIVVEYFKWVMLSHTWEGEEPTFKDVTEARSVHDLDRSPLDKKLRQFCETARKDDYRWAWSDTCCINKDSSTVLGQSLVSMYSWYEEAAETLVYLADVLSSSQIDALIKSRWMTRAWTLQELLAPKVIRFYDREWKLFLDDSDHPNHKESPVIKQALSQAMGLSPENITSFQPKHLGVREKLRLASTRNAGVEEDTAYSLIGIFSSDIVPQYGLGKVALGQLLENIVARTGDVTVISWTGKSLSYNSALPDSLAVYSKIPFAPPPMDINEFDTCMDKLRTGLAPQAPLDFYYRVTQLPRATFSDRCLRLPCAVFHVTNIGVQKLGGIRGNDYRAMVTLLGKVKFRTTDLMPLNKPQKLVFIHPWLRDLHDLRDGFESDDEREAESNVGSDDKWDSNSAESDGDSEHSTEYNSAPNSPLHAEPAAQMDPYTQALQLIVWLGRPFNALLLEQQSNNQYKRVAAENEIVISGVPYHTDPNDIEVKVLEII